MEAAQINPEKYGSQFPDSTNIIDALQQSKARYLEIKVKSFTLFKSKNNKYDGVSFVNTDDKVFHTLGGRVVGFARSVDRVDPKTNEKISGVNLQRLIDDASDGCVSVFFTLEKPDEKYSSRDLILSAGLIRPRG